MLDGVTDEDEEILPKPSPFRKFAIGFATLLKTPTTRWIFIGGCCRSWQGYTLGYYTLDYMNAYGKQTLYGTLNAICLFVGGILSNLIAGRMADKFESRNYRVKSLISAGMSFLCAPICICIFVVNFNFYFSMFFLFCEYLFCEGWQSPQMAMI